MSHHSYGKRLNRCPSRSPTSQLQCSHDIGHAGRHMNAISGATWVDLAESSVRLCAVSAPDLVAELETFIRAIVADGADDRGRETVAELRHARESLIAAFVGREGA